MSTTDSSAPAHTTDPATRAGDPFAAAAGGELPHACYEGWVYLGFEDEDGEHIEHVPCRRCRPEDL